MDSMYIPRPARLWKNKADFFRPFRTAPEHVHHGHDTGQLGNAAVDSEEEAELQNLNASLLLLVEVFPSIDPAVLRSMLSSLSSESRVEVVTEQVLRRRGRIPERKMGEKNTSRSRELRSTEAAVLGTRVKALEIEDTFRGDKYHNAVRTVLYQEFKSLSHSSIRAVVAENNGSYTRSRSVLQQIATRTWRFSHTWRFSLLNLWNGPSAAQVTDHPALVWDNEALPSVKGTGSLQLDHELHNLFVKPSLEQQLQDRMLVDQRLASKLNTEEAEESKATYDCECCYATVAFEDIATCASGEHILCYDCIRQTTSEALYGQGWARTADLDKATIRCFAPAIKECQSSIPSWSLKQALSRDLLKGQVWQEFQDRVSSECLLKSRIPLERCPHCVYAEANEIPTLRIQSLQETTDSYTRSLRRCMHPDLAHVLSPALAGITLLLELLAYMVFLPIWLLVTAFRFSFGFPASAALADSRIVSASIRRVYRRRRGLKFKCRYPACERITCLHCRGDWSDPHSCFEDEKTSLRTTIEASATAAVKRTCPRCMLSFVKMSGCNKLVCNCGYTMCYICRAEITSREGYGHFCQHFRPSGGRCNECDRCDLYGNEDEEAAIRQAATLAEQEWRAKQACKTQQNLQGESESAKAMIEAVLQRGGRGWWYEEVLDFCIDSRVVFAEDSS